VSKAIATWIDYHNTQSKKNTVQSYQSVIERFCQDFGDVEIEQVTPDDVLSFLNRFTSGNKPYTKRVRYSHLSVKRQLFLESFFNFFRNNIEPDMVNLCNTHDLRRHSATYASRSGVPIEIVSKLILRHANLSTTLKGTWEKSAM